MDHRVYLDARRQRLYDAALHGEDIEKARSLAAEYIKRIPKNRLKMRGRFVNFTTYAELQKAICLNQQRQFRAEL